MKPPIVCFVGRSRSGKTTFLEKLIPELVARGHRVGVVKHEPGKDTRRLNEAGAWRVVLSSPRDFAVFGHVEAELPLAEAAERYLGDVEIVLAEGYKRSDHLKVEICRAERSRELLCTPEELLAVVSDLRFDLPCPQFDLDDVEGVADLLEERFLRRPPASPPAVEVSLRVDGQEVSLKPFVQAMLAGAVRGLLAGLKSTEGKEIDLHVGGDGA